MGKVTMICNGKVRATTAVNSGASKVCQDKLPPIGLSYDLMLSRESELGHDQRDGENGGQKMSLILLPGLAWAGLAGLGVWR